jgi:hypothetical protein
MGDTKFFALDNIDYNNYYDYSLGISREQFRWLRREMRKTPDNQRIAILMHAPASNFRKGELIPYAKRLIRITKGHELHFVTGHGHRHFTADISDNVIEHSVAQVNGNLWFAPMCADGTPRGVFCIEERNGKWQWHHRVLGKSANEALIVWKMDDKENSDNTIIIKAIGGDDRWQVEWFENGESKGALESIEMCDPGYIYYVEHEAQYEDVIMERLRRSALPSRGYFRCLPTEKNSEITIIATDRFGRKYKWKSATN